MPKKRKTFLKTVLLLIVMMSSALFFAFPTFSQDFTQGYSTEQQLIRGSIVGLVKGETNKVETVASDRAEDMLGIVVRSNDSAVTLTDDRTGVFVATTSQFEILVSNLNGAITAGDYLTASNVAGVGQRATDRDKFTVGKALIDIDFTDPNTVLSSATITDSTGNEVQVFIGRVLAEVEVGPNPNAKENAKAPQFLINFSETVAGKPVSALRIYAGIVIILIASLISGSLLYSAVKSSIISIGRNPLSKRSVLTGLAQVVVISVIIFISGLIAVYLILKI